MRHLLAASLLSLCVASLPAQATEPSQASIERLLVVAQAQKNNAAVLEQVKGMLQPMFEQALGTRAMTADQREQAQGFMQEFSRKMVPILEEELAWGRLKDMTAQIYAQSFNQEEINGLIAFYESPAGRAFVEKMPVVMQKSMIAMQQRMGPLLQRITQAVNETAQEFKARQAVAVKP